MTGTATPWREHARRLAATLADEGTLYDPAWRAALEETPRHVFVPRFYVQQPDGEWFETADDAPDWLDAVYRNEPLITSLAATPNGNRVTVSSSTKPGLMVRMLEVLDVQDGHRVLEIGTGTGYNAALLAHRLGDERVFSVDIGADLVTDARERLAQLGLAPTLVAADGAAGLPTYSPYDRIIATCSVSAVPWAWAEQVREGGLVLVDLKRSTHAGNLVLLRRHADRLQGRFLPKWAGFMPIRGTDAAPDDASALADVEAGARSTTRLEPLPWRALVPWFLAHSRLPHGLAFGYRGAGGIGPEWAIFTAGDGSWCAVRMQADDDGTRQLRQGGPVAVWEVFEHAHRQWDALGRPGWDRLGLTVLPDGFHCVWLDESDGAYRWAMPPIG